MRKILLFLSLLFVVSSFSQPPTNPTTAVTVYSIQGDRASLSISKGNGSYRIVVIKKDSPVTFTPTDGSSYLSNATFGSGQQVAPGEYIVMNSASNSVTPTNLIPASTYHFAVFEFNGSGSSSNYLVTPNYVSSFNTLAAPTTQSTSLAVSNITANTLSLSWTPGNGDYSMILAKEGSPVNANPVDLSSYYANNTYYQVSNGPAQIGVGNFVLYKGTGSSVNIDNLNPNTTYHFAVFTFNGTSGPVYLTTNPSTAFATTLQYPTVQASNLLFDTIEGDRFRATWTAGNGAGRTAIIREGQPITIFPQNGTAYTGNPNFVNATDIGDGHKIIYSGVGNNVSINNLVSGTNYYIAVFEYAGSGSARTYNIINYPTAIQAPVVAPTQNVVSVTASLVTHDKATLTTVPGNGSGRFIVVRANNPTTYEPIDLNGYYSSSNPTLNDSYGNVGDGHEVVYKGTGNVVNLTNASPNTTYYVAAYELNGNNHPIYNKTSPALTTFTTLLPPAPTTPSANLNFTAEGNSLRLQWTRGNGERRMVIMGTAPITAVPQNGVQYTPNSNFTLAPEIALGEKVVYDNTTYSTTVTELEIGTTYYVRIYEYNGTDLLTNYLITPNLNGSYSTVSAPTISSNGMYVQQMSQDQLRVYWTNGNGSRKLMIGRLNEAVDAVPEDLTSYNASTYFNGGTEIAPGQRAKYYYTGAGLGQESYATIYSVSPGNTYHFKLFEANGNSAPVYNTLDPASVSYTIGYEPINPSTNMHTQSYDGGSMTAYVGDTGGGTKRIIVAKEGSPVTFIPQDGVDYVANENFSLGPDLGDGQKVVYDNASYAVNVTGLEHSKTYHFAVFEYGGTGSNIDYLTSAFATASGSTLNIPDQQASSISFNNITSLSSNVSWTNGDGTKRLVIAKRNSAVDIEPQDYTNYSSYSSNFGNSGALGNGNYVVYKDNSNNFNLSNLLSGTTYHVSVFEFNGSTSPVFKRPALSGSFTTLGPPQEQAQLQPFTNITTNSGQINCLAGSGQKRLIVMKAGSPITVLPAENTTYTPNTYLGSGSSLGDDTFAVYNGFDSQVTVTGLAQGVTYYLAVFEFNSFAGGVVNYLTPSTALGNFTTIVDPCFGVTCPPGTACVEGDCLPLTLQLTGIVRDATTLLPLENVNVSSSIDSAMTDSEGNYTISVLGTNSLTLTLLNYYNLVTAPITSSSSAFDLFMTSSCEGDIWYADLDSDGFGDENNTTEACLAPIGYIAIAGDCDDNNNTVYPGATEICYDGIDQNCNNDLIESCPIIFASLRNDNCGSTLTSIYGVLRGDNLSQSLPNGVNINGYRFKVTNLNTEEVRIVENLNYVFQISSTDIAEYATPYSVEVAVLLNSEWMPYGAACTVVTPDVPSTTLASTSCGTTIVQMNNIIRAIVIPAAVNYEYTVSLIENGIPVESTSLIRSGASFNLLQLSGISIKFGSEYRVQVKVQVPTPSGLEWSTNFGSTCSVFTPPAPDVQIIGCEAESGLIPTSLNSVIYASPVGGATQYRFTLTDGIAYNEVYTAPSRYFRLSNFDTLAELTAGGIYSVTVDTEIHGFYYAGKDCSILVPGGMFIKEDIKSDEEFIRTMPIEFKTTIHPNPFANSFNLDVKTSSQEPIAITIYDMSGRLLETKTLTVAETKAMQIGTKYPAGIYNAIVNQGENTNVIRIIKL